MRILVTGAGGFAGLHLLGALRTAFPASDIIGTGLKDEAGTALDVTDRTAVFGRLAEWQPDVCLHLAGIAAIGAAKADPQRAWAVNLQGALNVGEAILAGAAHCRMIFISSAECYGASFKAGAPLTEAAPLAPLNLYAATKAAAEMGLCALAADGLRLLRLRPFNHTGPGQSEAFVVPAFAGQIARIETGRGPREMLAGALDPERDFLDIRDVCAAYIKCIENFDTMPNGQVINIPSGRTVPIRQILDVLLGMARCQIAVRQDPARMRPVEIARAAGDPALVRELLDWQPEFSLSETLASVLEDARRRLGIESFSIFGRS